MNFDRTDADAGPSRSAGPAARAGHAPTLGRISDIELLRGFAILFVLVEHTRFNLIPWFSGFNSPLYTYFGFWSGVDLFFAISGFVIARSLLPMLAAARTPTEYFNSALSFWVRRAWRLLPSAWLWLALTLAASVVFNASGSFSSFRTTYEGAVAGVLQIANLRVAELYGRQEIGPSFHYWSLSLEEQFYLLLPFLFFIFRRWWIYFLVFGVLAQIGIHRSGAGTTELGLLLSQTRSDALLLGVLIAVWSRHPSYRAFDPVIIGRSSLTKVILPTGFLLLFAAASADPLHLVNFRVGVIALLSAAIVLVASYEGDYLFPNGIFRRVMVWFGSRSYAIYLIHIPAFRATQEIWHRIDPSSLSAESGHILRFLLTGGVLLIVLSELNYRLVEVPLRKRGARIAETLRMRKFDEGQPSGTT